MLSDVTIKDIKYWLKMKPSTGGSLYKAIDDIELLLKEIDRLKAENASLRNACRLVCNLYKVQTGNAQIDKLQMITACREALKE